MTEQEQILKHRLGCIFRSLLKRTVDSLKSVFNVFRREALLGTPVILIMPATNALSLPICFKKCAHVCPRRCCGLHPTLVKRIAQRPKMNDISLRRYRNICADICALECPHSSCGLGSLKRSFIPRGTPQLA